jgi:hypothetical protein
MKYIKNLSQFLVERLNSAEGRRMMQLVDYFDKTIEEKEEELPEFFDNNYPQIFENWCMDNSEYFLDMEGYDSEEEALENVIYPTTHYELNYYPEAEKAYKEFLVGVVDDVFKNNSYDLDLCVLPLYVTYTHEGDVEDDWLVHFTGEKESQESILKSGYFNGISEMKNLAITAAANEWVDDGYCFSFSLNDIGYNFKSDYSHYGEYGILFKSSGIKLYHNGDDEIQTIFIGNQVSNLIPFWYDSKTKELYNKDNTIRTNDYEEFFEQMTK